MLASIQFLFVYAVISLLFSETTSAGDLILARDYYLFGGHCNYGRNWGSQSGTHLGFFRIDPIVSKDPPFGHHGTYSRWSRYEGDAAWSSQPTRQSHWRR